MEFEDRITFGDGCWLWKGKPGSGGYGSWKHGQAHRASWEFYRGPIPAGLQVCHRCDVPLCVNPDHLFIGTQSDNIQDMYAKGRGRKKKEKPVKSPRIPLTPEEAREKNRQKCNKWRSKNREKYNAGIRRWRAKKGRK